jgi:hypothetical protein
MGEPSIIVVVVHSEARDTREFTLLIILCLEMIAMYMMIRKQVVDWRGIAS